MTITRSRVKREKGFGKKRSLEKGGYGESFEEQKKNQKKGGEGYFGLGRESTEGH